MSTATPSSKRASHSSGVCSSIDAIPLLTI